MFFFHWLKGNIYIIFDIDDYLLPNTLARILNIALKNKVDVIGFKTKETLTHSHDNVNLTEDDSSNLKVVNGAEFLLENPTHRHEVWWYIVNKKFALENNYTFGKYDTNEDILIYY